MDINQRSLSIQQAELVPIALGKYLFTFRTQKSSPAAAIILQQREDSKVPYYTENHPNGWFSVVCYLFLVTKKYSDDAHLSNSWIIFKQNNKAKKQCNLNLKHY